MKINIGTANPIKIEALRETLSGSEILRESQVKGVDTGSTDCRTAEKSERNRARR